MTHNLHLASFPLAKKNFLSLKRLAPTTPPPASLSSTVQSSSPIPLKTSVANMLKKICSSWTKSITRLWFQTRWLETQSFISCSETKFKLEKHYSPSSANNSETYLICHSDKIKTGIRYLPNQPSKPQQETQHLVNQKSNTWTQGHADWSIIRIETPRNVNQLPTRSIASVLLARWVIWTVNAQLLGTWTSLSQLRLIRKQRGE